MNKIVKMYPKMFLGLSMVVLSLILQSLFCIISFASSFFIYTNFASIALFLNTLLMAVLFYTAYKRDLFGVFQDLVEDLKNGEHKWFFLLDIVKVEGKITNLPYAILLDLIKTICRWFFDIPESNGVNIRVFKYAITNKSIIGKVVVSYKNKIQEAKIIEFPIDSDNYETEAICNAVEWIKSNLDNDRDNL